jgi:RND family efflux transporter MFP subunit
MTAVKCPNIAKWPWPVFCMAAVLGAGCEKQSEVSIVRPVRAVKVGDVAGINGAAFPGRARAAEQVNLAFRVSGELEYLIADVGTIVNKGDVIARVDPRDFQASVDNMDAELQRAIAQLDAMAIARPEEIRKLQAQVREAEAVLELAAAEYSRMIALQEPGVDAVSQTEVDRSKASRDRSSAMLDQSKESLIIAREGARPEDIRAQQAEIKSLEAKLATATNNLKYTELIAPFDGTIAARYVDNFQTAQAGQVICRLLDSSRIELVIDIPESKIALAPYVSDLICVFDAFPDVKISGAKITEIGNEASATTRTYPVTVVMDQPDESTGAKILPGMAGLVSGTARLSEEAESKGFVIPESALFESDSGDKHVWLIDESKMTVHRSQSVTPSELDALGVRVKEIDAGQWVVTAGVHYLDEGQKVRILAEQTTAVARQPKQTTEVVRQSVEDTESSDPETPESSAEESE